MLEKYLWSDDLNISFFLKRHQAMIAEQTNGASRRANTEKLLQVNAKAKANTKANKL